MLTILSWIIFIPAAVWNITFFAYGLAGFLDWSDYRNRRDAIISLAFLLVPGVYLFGLW